MARVSSLALARSPRPRSRSRRPTAPPRSPARAPSCHRDGQTTAPTPAVLRQLTPEGILNALTQGRMQVQGATLSEGERRAVAEYVAGRALATATTAVPNRCTTSPPMTDAATSPGWNGWGNGAANTRFAANAGLTAADLPRLKLKWAFGYAGVNAARAQPTIAGGRLFVASENGEAHALDPKTGCTYWTFRAQAGIRTGLTVGPYKNASGSGQAVYFGDVRANAYAVDAQTGRQLWVRKVDEHPAASLTGAPAVSGGRVFVPVQGLNEEGQGGTGKYPCCTFRGSLVALDANTGAQLWKTYTVDAPQPRGKNAAGIQMSGPAGGGIWAAPTVDTKRGVGLRRHRQRLRRSAAADDQRGGRDGRADRRGEVGAADDAQRQLDARLPAEEPRQSGVPRNARPRLRLLRLAVARHRERPRPAGAAAEVGHRVGDRSRQGRRGGVAAPHRPGQRPRRPVGRRRGRPAAPTSACRTCCRRTPAACARSTSPPARWRGASSRRSRCAARGARAARRRAPRSP